MLPLLLLPGAGSVIYRGLAAVIVGGMTVSTIFTLLLLPTLLRMTATLSAAKSTLSKIESSIAPPITSPTAKQNKYNDHV
jgi:hypothetical protein